MRECEAGIVFRAEHSRQHIYSIKHIKFTNSQQIRIFDLALIGSSVLLISIFLDNGVVSVILGFVKVNLDPLSIVILLDFD